MQRILHLVVWQQGLPLSSGARTNPALPVNAEKVALSGKKMTNRVYTRYTGYPGGQRFTTPAEILRTRPAELIRRSVKGMLPKTRLGDKLYGNLYVYAGPEHPHQAQNPKEIKLNEI